MAVINAGVGLISGIRSNHQAQGGAHFGTEVGPFCMPISRRNEILHRVLPPLEPNNIYSHGRFGARKYEVSNQDHSFMLGRRSR
jgi:hypothetical protein